MKVHRWCVKSQKKSLDLNLVMSNTRSYILGYIDMTIYLSYSISTRKYTPGTVNHKKKSLDSNLVMSNTRFYILGIHRYDDCFY